MSEVRSLSLPQGFPAVACADMTSCGEKAQPLTEFPGQIPLPGVAAIPTD